MSKLPPLPEPGVYDGIWHEPVSFSDGQMREYGKQCRDAALDEAAEHCDTLQAYPSTEPRHCAEDIRILKNE